MRVGPNFDDKMSWTFKEVQAWLDKEHPGYFVPYPGLGSFFFCFREDGTLYAYSNNRALDELTSVGYTGEK